MRKVLVVVCALFAVAFAGCAGVAPNTVLGTPMNGWVFSEIEYPHPRTEVTNQGVGSKRGEAMVKNYLGLIATGDGSIEEAMKNGEINQVYTVDHKLLNILGIYAEWTTVVTGE
jgi:hypothetical protein